MSEATHTGNPAEAIGAFDKAVVVLAFAALAVSVYGLVHEPVLRPVVQGAGIGGSVLITAYVLRNYFKLRKGKANG